MLDFLDSTGLDQNAIQLQILFFKTREEGPARLFRVHQGCPTSTGSECRVGGEGHGCLHLGFKGQGNQALGFQPRIASMGTGPRQRATVGLKGRVPSHRKLFQSLMVYCCLPYQVQDLFGTHLPLPSFLCLSFGMGQSILCLSHQCIM